MGLGSMLGNMKNAATKIAGGMKPGGGAPGMAAPGAPAMGKPAGKPMARPLGGKARPMARGR